MVKGRGRIADRFHKLRAEVRELQLKNQHLSEHQLKGELDWLREACKRELIKANARIDTAENAARNAEQARSAAVKERGEYCTKWQFSQGENFNLLQKIATEKGKAVKNETHWRNALAEEEKLAISQGQSLAKLRSTVARQGKAASKLKGALEMEPVWRPATILASDPIYRLQLN